MKKIVLWATTIVAILVLASCGSHQPSAPETPAPSASASTPEPDGSPSVEEGSVLQALLSLRTAPEAKTPKYDRGAFGQAWKDVDSNGCDQRNDVLRRDLLEKSVKPGTGGCVVLSGELKFQGDGYFWYSHPAHYERGNGAVEIDHVVSLADAWRSGAHEWTAEQRSWFANDLMELEAVDRATNRDKGDRDVGHWLPEIADGVGVCGLVSRVIAIKTAYDLTVDEHEAISMEEALLSYGCQDQPLPLREDFEAPELVR